MNRFVLCALLLVISTNQTLSEESASRTGLLFAGHHERAEIHSAVKGSRKTKLAAAYTWKYGVRLYTAKTWDKSSINWEAFSKNAAQIADAIAKKIKPAYVRDHRGVIVYAIVRDSDPFFSSVITSPFFLARFADTLGDKLDAVVLDRNVVYVFPANSKNLAEFGPALVGIYKKTPLPVSLEVFRIDKSGFRVVGEIER